MKESEQGLYLNIIEKRSQQIRLSVKRLISLYPIVKVIFIY